MIHITKIDTHYKFDLHSTVYFLGNAGPKVQPWCRGIGSPVFIKGILVV